MAVVLEITPTESVEIRSSGPAALEVEATYGTGEPPPKHFYPAQDEHFEVLAGAIQVRVDGEERSLGVGEEIDIPRGAAHQIWNPAREPARPKPGAAASRRARTARSALAVLGRARGYSK
jgi:mannose-6-phosphate isomerase-like protein (cupin superfamily)